MLTNPFSGGGETAREHIRRPDWHDAARINGETAPAANSGVRSRERFRVQLGGLTHL